MIQGLSQGFASDHQAVDIVPDAKMQFIHQGNVTWVGDNSKTDWVGTSLVDQCGISPSYC